MPRRVHRVPLPDDIRRGKDQSVTLCIDNYFKKNLLINFSLSFTISLNLGGNIVLRAVIIQGGISRSLLKRDMRARVEKIIN